MFTAAEARRRDVAELHEELRGFRDFGSTSAVGSTEPTGGGAPVPTYANEFWTAKQRAAHSLHEVSYRACFKPQLPRFFIERLTAPGARVHDPFLGRGTTVVEAALLGRRVSGCDANPLSAVLCAPRLRPPRLVEVEARLQQVDWLAAANAPLDDDALKGIHFAAYE